MPESSLVTLHQQLDAKLADYGGWSLPAHYTDPATERNHVRRGCGIIDLSNRGTIRFTGKDRQTFLQGMVSNDTRLLEEGKGIYATLLNPKGHMLGDLTLYAFPEFYLADTEPGMAAFIARTLDRYIIREKVSPKVEDEERALVGFSGPHASTLLRKVFPNAPELSSPYGCAALTWQGAEVHLMRRNFTGEVGFQISLPKDQAPSLWEAFVQAGAEPFGQDALEILRVEAAIPQFGKDTSSEVIPLEAGLTFGISREKGCYIGQEIIERISSRGHTNRRLAPLKLTGTFVPPTGAELEFNGKKVGTVSSVTFSPELGQPVGMGYVRKEAWLPGTELKLLNSDETSAVVLEDPAFGSGEPPSIRNVDAAL